MKSIHAKKQVHFDMCDNIVLITYENPEDCWYTEYDYMQSKIIATSEIRTLLLRHPKMKSKDAIRLLFQPNNIRYDNDNFI
jgi:hypothetical protein